MFGQTPSHREVHDQQQNINKKPNFHTVGRPNLIKYLLGKLAYVGHNFFSSSFLASKVTYVDGRALGMAGEGPERERGIYGPIECRNISYFVVNSFGYYDKKLNAHECVNTLSNFKVFFFIESSDNFSPKMATDHLLLVFLI